MLPLPNPLPGCAPWVLQVNALPNSTALRSRWQLPVGVLVRPMGDEALGMEVGADAQGRAKVFMMCARLDHTRVCTLLWRSLLQL